DPSPRMRELGVESFATAPNQLRPDRTWSFKGFIPGVPNAAGIISQAFQKWSLVTPALRFNRVASSNDIVVGAAAISVPGVLGTTTLSPTGSANIILNNSNAVSFVAQGGNPSLLAVGHARNRPCARPAARNDRRIRHVSFQSDQRDPWT